MKLNHVYHGDNLEIMRGFDDAVIDLIYIDPPFNTGKTQKSTVNEWEYKDDWSITKEGAIFFSELKDINPTLYRAIEVSKYTHSREMFVIFGYDFPAVN